MFVKMIMEHRTYVKVIHFFISLENIIISRKKLHQTFNVLDRIFDSVLINGRGVKIVQYARGQGHIQTPDPSPQTPDLRNSHVPTDSENLTSNIIVFATYFLFTFYKSPFLTLVSIFLCEFSV